MTYTSTGFVQLSGRVLYVTDDLDLISRQLRGENLPYDPKRPLMSNISTDEITPGWSCYYYDATLARYCLVGLRGERITPDDIRRGGFEVIVSGRSKGCGSSRETAPYAELASGIRIVFAESIEKIYRQNAHNIGLLTSTDFSLLERLVCGERVPLDAFTRPLDPLSAAIVEEGGLFAFSRHRLRGGVRSEPVTGAPRALTLCEKIIAAHVVSECDSPIVGQASVRPGDALFVRADVRYTHEYVTPMAQALFYEGFGADAQVREPETVFAFRDHLTLLDQVMTPEHRAMGLDRHAAKLATVQATFAQKHGIRLFGEVVRNGGAAGSEAICHNKVIEEIAWPGQLVVGTDSHTCMVGALGCFAFGVGSTDMANAWLTRDVRLTVPETIRVVLTGQLRRGVAAKDVMLLLLSHALFREGRAVGKVLEFTGPGTSSLSLDERATLTNMAVEAGGFTGIIEADELVVSYLSAQRGVDPALVRARLVRGDPDAHYAAEVALDLSEVEPMVATPGDPRNGVSLQSLTVGARPMRIDIAYGGSCTGGKKADMDMYAAVFEAALARGQRVSAGVSLFIQFGSQEIRAYAAQRGYIDLFEAVGASLVEPSCGACIRAGPGVSSRADQVTVSAINRNFPGRSGPGAVYLASPWVVAASAIQGRLASPLEIFGAEASG